MSNLQWKWGEWEPLYKGIERATAISSAVPFPAVPIPFPPGQKPYQTINLLRVNLADPHISTYSTPAAGLQQDGVTVETFLKATFNKPSQIAMEGIVAINANYFDYPGPPRSLLFGPAVSNGLRVPWQPPMNSQFYTLAITKTNHATILGKDEQPGGDTWTAVSGNSLLLRNGALQVPSPSPATATPIVAARTVVGVSYNPHYLYVLTVDGLETNTNTAPYYGATDFDSAVLMLLAGATDAINLDGGGSTTLGRIDNHGFALMNVPHGDDSTPGLQRAVGNCFAILVRE
jgi:hypothetical protein